MAGDVAAAGKFRGDGSSLTALNASELRSGTLDDARLSANVARLDGNNAFSGTQSFGNVAVGGTISGSGAGW